MSTGTTRPTTSAVILCAVISIQACGDKKKSATATPPVLNPSSDDATRQPKHSEWVATETDLPVCSADDEGKLAWVADTKKLFLCHSSAWTSITPEGTGTGTPSGSAPSPSQSTVPAPAPAAPLSFLVIDGSGKTIGRTDFSGYLKSIDLSAFSFQLSDGSIFKVNPVNGGFSGEQCVYNAADCSSTCLYPATASQKNKIVQGANGFYRISGSEVAGSASYSAYTLGDFPAPLCAALGSTQTGTLAELTISYAFPDGISYPLAAPLSVRAE